QAIEDHNLDDFQLILDTFESSLEDEQAIEKVKKFQTYIVGHWDYVKDWRKRISSPPKDTRGLGAIESNQRKISFRMKKRSMHCRADGAQAMVKLKHGIYNGSLRDVYLASQKRSIRKQHEVKHSVRMSEYFRQYTQPSIGAN